MIRETRSTPEGSPSMKEKGKLKNHSKTLKLPILRLQYRLLLYFFMLLFATLAMLHVLFQCFPDIIGIACYALAACTLFPGVYYLIFDIKYGIKEIIKSQISANPYANRVATDYRLRTILFAVPGLASNILFAIFNGVTGFISQSAWLGSLSAYYILLSMMRIGVVKQEKNISKVKQEQEKERLKKEIAIYQKNSILFILMAAVLGGMVILLEALAGGKSYPGYTIYAAAAYTFYRIIMSTIQLVKVKKQKSPILRIIRKIGCVDACVSILILQTAMFDSFAKEQEDFTKLMNGITGAVVTALVLGIGIQGIYVSKRMKIQLEAGGK